jgi:hypothetical protein
VRALVPIERGAQIFCCYVDRETAGKPNTQAKEVADIDVLAGGGGGAVVEPVAEFIVPYWGIKSTVT